MLQLDNQKLLKSKMKFNIFHWLHSFP